MSHRDALADHELEHVVEELWTLAQDGRNTRDELARISRVEDLPEALGRLAARGLIRLEGSRVVLSVTGSELAEQQARRHRLAELLLSSALQVRDGQVVDRTACVMEHILDAAVTDSVCSFLGHPTRCPHGEPIPPGPCCRSFSNAVEPLVLPLVRLPVGQTARVVYIVSRGAERLVRLSSLGLTPGVEVRLLQRQPATVVSLGETTLAIERDIAAEIFVRRVA
jgi:DtxR family Mn-dependent transcriptional regulator